MISFKYRFLSFYNKAIAYLIGLMGFAAGCIPEPVEYGMPSATFRLKGTIQSKQTELFIPNIKIIIGEDTTYSNVYGEFEIKQIAFPEEQTFIVHFKDLDKDLNEHLQDIDTTITFSNPTFTNGDGKWYKGETEKIIEIKMNPFNEKR